MNKIILCGMLLWSAINVAAQSISLQFNNDSLFKIVQFTDVHYKYDDQANSQIALDRINEVLSLERPDLVIFTGDVVVSNDAFKGWDVVLAPLIKRNIPFGVVFGNHDDEYDRSRVELYDYIAAKKGSLMPKRVDDKTPDYLLTLKSSKDKKRDAAALYCIDSHSYTPINSVPGYDWIKFDQIGWYRNQSQKLATNNNGTPLPALAFFHIAIPEYRDAVLEEKNRLFGVRGEIVCCPTTNSGLFTSFKECGDVMGTFVGHDHNNDYAVLYKDILLAYGRYTGGNTVYNALPNGARVIVLKEGTRSFDTYIFTPGGNKESIINYPASFK